MDRCRWLKCRWTEVSRGVGPKRERKKFVSGLQVEEVAGSGVWHLAEREGVAGPFIIRLSSPK